ncbi:MAG: DNA-directed RNA polymerase subunit beta' [Candidatus Shikimatogenerans sp. JK-2022]|nr:DNA-directed RNA polymerase subunit beta' [Candidatus Shikimatogenerans bostrichidophilus]
MKTKKINISFASPESILKQSYGEVLNSETINYRTKKPELYGLFCEKIFGPIKNYECSCGKYKKIKYKGIFCDRCGIEITKKIVRRKRFGHIKLAVPIVHIWGFKCLPNKIAYLIGKTSKEIEEIIYYIKYIILDLGSLKYIFLNNKKYKKFDLINEEEYFKLKNLTIKNKKIKIKTGGEAIYYILKNINLKKIFLNLTKKINNKKYNFRKKTILKRIKIIKLFLKGKEKSKPEYLIITILPIIPPDLRPLVQLENGKYASSDLNDFYRKIIIRNNRLKKLIEIEAPDIILKNEKRMLQESVDYLLDNSRRFLSLKSNKNRILKSLTDILKGKLGRFRYNLLGKRVDYSARSVIVVDPNLKIYQCGLPIEMALELFKPFLIQKLIKIGLIKTEKSAKKIIKKKKKKILEILKKILENHPILLNRAPTLHRYSIQAFYPVLIKSKTIKLHPLVCSAFNADFDGDQMAVHLPLSTESILEAKLLMLSPQNILNISNGNPIITPNQDIILGLYYMTLFFKKKDKKKIKNFYSVEELKYCFNLKLIKLHDIINLKYNNEKIITTVGRAFFNNIIPKTAKINFINKTIKKKNINNIIIKIYKKTNIIETSKFLDKLKKIGLKYIFLGGLSFNIQDIIMYKEKEKILNKSKKKINNIYKHYNMGFITDKDKYNKIIDLWSKTTSKISKKVIENIKKKDFNSVYMMLDSGARSSKEQIKQLSGIRGLMAKPKKYNLSISSSENYEDTEDYNKIIETPILSNFLEGLSVYDFFLSTHGARKGLADTALKTADAGYLTRRLVDVAQDIIIKEKDCKTLNGIKIENKKFKFSNSDILGRIVLFDFKINKKEKIKRNTIINEKLIKKINKNKISSILIRSPLTCETNYGICSKCYGINLSNRKIVQKGETIGVIAAQSIGEPGTQLTLRTFHVGGATKDISKETELISKYKGKIFFKKLKYIKKKKKFLVISKLAKLLIKEKKKILLKKNIPYGSYLFFKNKEKIKKGDILYEYDPYNALIISEVSGLIKYKNLIKNKTYKINIDKNTGYKEKIIISNDKIIPSLIILNEKKVQIKEYSLPLNSYLKVKNNEKIKKGKILIKIPRISSKYTDITGGLPRLAELFESREPYNKSILSEINGIVKFGKIQKKNIDIYIESYEIKKKIKYKIPNNKQILVQENDNIKNGNKLTDGRISLNDLLNIKGKKYLQKYLIKKIQEVYKTQGVEINNKHFEVILSKMMNRVKIINSGDTDLIVGDIIDKRELIKKNKKIKKKVIIKKKYKKYYKGQFVYKEKVKIINKFFKKKIIEYKKTKLAIAKPILLGITKEALFNKSFLSAASFQETSKVLCESAISNKTDYLEGLKENVIIGNKIPAGTGYKDYNTKKIQIKSKKIYK